MESDASYFMRRYLMVKTGLEESIADLDFIRQHAKEADIAALAEAASAVAKLYLKQAKGEI
jgi:hypothetical protein